MAAANPARPSATAAGRPPQTDREENRESDGRHRRAGDDEGHMPGAELVEVRRPEGPRPPEDEHHREHDEGGTETPPQGAGGRAGL